MALSTAEYQRQWRAANKDRVRAYEKAWVARNIDKVRAAARAYYYRNRETILENIKLPHERARRREAVRRWVLKNPDKVLAGRIKSKPQKWDAAMLRRYGINKIAFDQMADRQDHSCAICRRPNLKLVVDHDHESGEIRGLLCRRCNLGLGHFLDDVVALRAAADYVAARTKRMELVS